MLVTTGLQIPAGLVELLGDLIIGITMIHELVFKDYQLKLDLALAFVLENLLVGGATRLNSLHRGRVDFNVHLVRGFGDGELVALTVVGGSPSQPIPLYNS